MKWQTRCFHQPRPAYARRVRNFFYYVANITVLLGAVTAARASFAQGDTLPGSLASEEIVATGAVYLESGLPNRTNLAGPFTTPYYENDIVGATRFYDAGFTGSRAVMANIEAGYVWSGHETLTHVNFIPTSGALGQFDRHATWVAMVMGGRPGGASPGLYQQGIAPDAQFFSGAIATGWLGTRWSGSFTLNFSNSTYGPYRTAFTSGLFTPTGQRSADVINSSWNMSPDSGTTGNDAISGVLDALANTNPRTLHVVAAGNTGAGPNQVAATASAYNNIVVAALAFNGGAYNIPTGFSSGGPNDYQDPNRFVSAVRQVVDIAAPGQNFSTAYYGGETGGNGPSLSGPPNGPAGGPNWYTHSINGTSFSTPTVAGGAALLYDAAYAMFAANPDARDARVIKSVLMNSADKTLSWNNGQVPHPNGNGGVFTTQGLDNRVGAGRLNLSRAFDQFLGGTTDVPGTMQGLLGTVDPVGWDFGLVAQGTTNDYLFNVNLLGGSPFTATLTWFRDREPLGFTSFRDASYDNLDLELWKAINGAPTELISASASLYNNSEHFHFTIPTTGQYMLRVRWTGEWFDIVGDLNREHYGLAWYAVAVPEPASILLILFGMGVCMVKASTWRRIERIPAI